MPEHKTNLFINMDKKEKNVTVEGLVLLIILVVAFVLILYFFGLAAIFELLDVQYKSIWS